MSHSASRKISIGHTSTRREELSTFLQSILMLGKLNLGSLNLGVWFSLKVILWPSTLLCREDTSFCVQGCDFTQQELRSAVMSLVQCVSSAEPLCIQPLSQDTWILYTDGACEPEKCWGGIGAVLFGPNRCVAGFFGESVDARVMKKLFSHSKNRFSIWRLRLF